MSAGEIAPPERVLPRSCGSGLQHACASFQSASFQVATPDCPALRELDSGLGMDRYAGPAPQIRDGTGAVMTDASKPPAHHALHAMGASSSRGPESAEGLRPALNASSPVFRRPRCPEAKAKPLSGQHFRCSAVQGRNELIFSSGADN